MTRLDVIELCVGPEGLDVNITNRIDFVAQMDARKVQNQVDFVSHMVEENGVRIPNARKAPNKAAYVFRTVVVNGVAHFIARNRLYWVDFAPLTVEEESVAWISAPKQLC